MLAIVEVYALFYLPSIKESHFWPGPDILQNWGGYLNLGVPGAIMLCTEKWAFALQVVLAGTLSVNQ